MVGLVLICLSLPAVAIATAAHFRILAGLEQAGVRVKYFATPADSLRAYAAYRRLARDQRWPLWPAYAVFGGYVGVLLAGLALFLDSPLETIMRCLNEGRPETVRRRSGLPAFKRRSKPAKNRRNPCARRGVKFCTVQLLLIERSASWVS